MTPTRLTLSSQSEPLQTYYDYNHHKHGDADDAEHGVDVGNGVAVYTCDDDSETKFIDGAANDVVIGVCASI